MGVLGKAYVIVEGKSIPSLCGHSAFTITKDIEGVGVEEVYCTKPTSFLAAVGYTPLCFILHSLIVRVDQASLKIA